MMMRIGVDRLRRDDEVDRNDIGSLMQKLEEGVLSVGARLAENDRARWSRDGRAGAGDGFAVRFHIELLEIGRKPRQTLVIGDNSVGGAPES